MTTTLEDDGMCFCCGQKNPIGLKLQFEMLPDGRMRTEWTPRREHQGFKDIVHGGLVATLMDEVMIRLLYALGIRAVTAELSTRLLRPMRAGKRYRFESRLLEDKGRVVTAEAEGFDAESGELMATGSTKCMRLKEGVGR
ncbi:MAG TPA: PaaI family thioesterase [Candidatus Dormibacteraeota bacterium]|nr:PaaI family thioesterase [Candidatus Dormibacteraeota bacterium]